MQPRLSKLLALISFVLFIGLFLSYRTGNLDRLLTPGDGNAPVLRTDTLPQAYKDSLALDFLMDSLKPARFATSKSIILLKDADPILAARLAKDTPRLRATWQRYERQLTLRDSMHRNMMERYERTKKSIQ